MAIGLDVIPTTSASICWNRIIASLTNVVKDVNRIPRNFQIHNIRTQRQLDEFESLACPGYHYCSSDDGCTLSIAIEPAVNGEDIWDYVSDYGRNLGSTEQTEVAGRWTSAGFLIGIDSGGGRPLGETRTLMNLSLALAQLTLGYVVVKDEPMHELPVGIYLPSEVLKRRENGASLDR